ncbi:hypothetical protein BCV70DRAFT_196166 [Testicularia cyperi]|uniref:PH domain-containing protein n=1 Tax=Testicularia cyperi TaxID=1882483 RepID=A0A317XGY0_9BASI|nr:hypothetical protein BCV70DRAFT_196166 [Testicularia cyperi]
MSPSHDPTRRPSPITTSGLGPQQPLPHSGLADRSPGPGSARPFQPSHNYSQSTSVLLNSSVSRQAVQQQQQQQQQQNLNGQRSVSMRPMSAFQPLDNPEYYAGTGSTAGAASPSVPRPPSPAGSMARSVRSTQTQMTFKSQDLRSALSLQEAQQKKLYMEGYLLKRDDLGTDGKPIHTGDDKRRWTECFVQLSGTVLSLWNVEQMEDAARRGTEVPPTYINITDSFVDFIGLLIEDPKLVPGSRGRYHHAFAINSAGNNRTIFCFRDPPPFPPDSIEKWLAPEHRQKPEHRTVIGWLNLGHRHLQAWINAIRLASWEKVRLEEIYTGALIRARLGASGSPASPALDTSKDAPGDMTIKSPLIKGKMEGWVKARFMGTTEWKKVWMVLTDHKPDESEFGAKKKFWKLGGSGDRSSVMSISSVSNNAPGAPGADGAADLPPPPGGNGAPGVASFFESKKAKKPFATLIYAAHAFAVYPSRPELVEGSSLLKVEGVFPASTVLSATHRVRTTGWVMLMPELEASGSKGANAEMMKWIIAFMDAFKLYGRPDNFVWDARSPISPFFAYPIGPFKDRLFLDRELAEFLEIAREDHLTTRSSLHGIMAARMRGERTKILQPLPPPSQAAAVPKTADADSADASNGRAGRQSEVLSMAQKLPPLDFDSDLAGSRTVNAGPNSASVLPSTLAADRQNGLGHGFKDTELAEQQAAPEAPRPASPDLDGPRPPREYRPGFSGEQGLSSSSSSFAARDVAPPLSVTGTTSGTGAGVVTAGVPVSGQAPVLARNSDATTGLGAAPVGALTSSMHANATGTPPAALPSAPATSAQMQSSPTGSSLAYMRPSADSNSAATHTTAPVARAPAVLGPSGRGAEAGQSEELPNKRFSDLPANYDESALFYMASISDQLPATTATAPPLAIVQPATTVPQNLATSSSQASQSQGAGLNSGVTSAVPSESTHATRMSSDPVAPPPGDAVALAKAENELPGVRAATNPDDSINDDALAAYSFLEQPPSPVVNTRSLPAPPNRSMEPQQQRDGPVPLPAGQIAASANPTRLVSEPSGDLPATAVRPPAAQYPSTFGQNKRAQERKTAAQLQALAHQEALSRPGRSGVRKAKGPRGAGWADDSDDDDDDEEEDEEDEEEDEHASHRPGAQSGTYGRSTRSAGTPASGSVRGAGTGSNSPAPGMSDSIGSLARSNDSANVAAAPSLALQQQQLGMPMSGSIYGGLNGPRSMSPGQSPMKAGQPHPSMQAYQRQSMFNSHLAAAHGDESRSNTPPQGPVVRDRQTFLQLNPEEQPGAMTTVFTPHGLVQAGAQEKAERSAKAQEAEARAYGGHLVNVPNKPPPPQAGLLGAITAHERDRKGAGGYGATLTERERERVAAERRQREEDLLRQQQQQQMQQMAYFNPLMYQQMMMGGMMPGMGMMGMGMPHMAGFGGSQIGGSQMGGGFDPIMAQQQAMQAAQMAYMNALSQAHQEGSAIGHGSVMGHGSPSAMPASTMGMPMGSMPFMASPHMSMMGAPFAGFMSQTGVASPASEGGAIPSNRPGSTKPTSSPLNGQGQARD